MRALCMVLGLLSVVGGCEEDNVETQSAMVRPRYQLSFTVKHLDTDVTFAEPITILLVDMRAGQFSEAQVAALTGGVTLATWPDGNTVAVDIEVQTDNQNRKVTSVTYELIPAEQLPKGWYQLAIDLPNEFTEELRSGGYDGGDAHFERTSANTFGVRFSVGSYPVVQQARLCDGDDPTSQPDDSVLTLLFSEDVVVPTKGTGVELSQQTQGIEWRMVRQDELAGQKVGSIRYLLSGYNPDEALLLDVTDDLIAVSGEVVETGPESSAITFDPGNAGADGCQTWHLKSR